MTDEFLLRTIYFVLFSYLIAGLSTTDIMRLTRDQYRSLISYDSHCEHCGYLIPLSNQLPIVSHLMNRGRCKNCNAKIPSLQLLMECVLLVALLLIGLLTDFQKNAFVYSLLFYEGFKGIVIVCKGARKKDFWRQLLSSLLINLALFGSGYLFYYLFSFFLL